MLAALLLIAARLSRAPPRPSKDASETSRSTGPIFSAGEERETLFRRLVNATHWTTRESVVRREIWKRRGDPVDEAFAAELERNLRALGLFAEADVTLVPREDSDVVDLRVETRDRFSIAGGASGSFVGNVASGGVSLSESNLFGGGDRVSFGFSENEDDEFRGSISYRDRYLFGTWTGASAQVGRDGPG